MISELSKVAIKHQTDEWTTPRDLFETLDNEFHFTLDPCCSEDNYLCEKHYTEAEDGLKQNWGVRRSSAIRLTVKQQNGWRRRSMKAGQITRLWLC